MARKRTGSTYLKGNIRQVRITTDRDGALKPRWSKPCPPNQDGTPMSEIDARKVAADLQKAYDAGKWDPWAKPVVITGAPKATEELVQDYIARWFASRIARGLRSIRSEQYRFTIHVQPEIGTVPIAKVTRVQIEDLVASLDAKVRAGKIRPKTAQNVWAMVTKIFSDAKGAKSRHLRVRQDNPCADVAGPDRGPARSGSYLYPSEFTTLLACEQVDRKWRRIIAIAVCTYTRAGELEALDWSDVDLAHNTIHIHASVDATTGERRETKTAAGNRRIPIEPSLRPLLEAMRDEANGEGRVVLGMPDRRRGAGFLRDALQLAQVNRADLFASDGIRRPLSFHDLRATGTTWCAVRGDEPLRIMQRAGHTDFKTTQIYIREAENLRRDFGTVFPALPDELLGKATRKATQGIGQSPIEAENMRLNELDSTGAESFLGNPSGSKWQEQATFRDQNFQEEPPESQSATPNATDVAIQNKVLDPTAPCPHCGGTGRVSKAVRS